MDLNDANAFADEVNGRQGAEQGTAASGFDPNGLEGLVDVVVEGPSVVAEAAGGLFELLAGILDGL